MIDKYYDKVIFLKKKEEKKINDGFVKSKLYC